MYNPYNGLESLKKERDKIDSMISNYQQMPQTPINNIIAPMQPQTQSNNMIEWRILNENETVDNLYVSNKTLFINDENMVLKGVDGSLEKWKIKKIYPIDKKDEKINELELKLKEMEMKLNEYSKLYEPNDEVIKSNEYDDVNVKSKPKTSSK